MAVPKSSGESSSAFVREWHRLRNKYGKSHRYTRGYEKVQGFGFSNFFGSRTRDESFLLVVAFIAVRIYSAEDVTDMCLFDRCFRRFYFF